MGFFVEPLEHVITLRGQILVSRTDDDPPLPSTRVYVQNVPVCTRNDDNANDNDDDNQPAASFDSTRKNPPGPDTARIDR